MALRSMARFRQSLRIGVIHQAPKRIPGVLAALVVGGVVTGCATARVDERIAYWNTEVAANLPIGASRQQAEGFFASRGTALKCCVTPPNGKNYSLAFEHKVGRMLWMEYDVAVLVLFAPDDKVAEVSVERWGVGF